MGLLIVLVGCGDITKNKVIKRELDSSQFSVDCQLDVKEFSNILEKNIGSQIRCLGENLHLFIRMVESDQSGYMSRTALEAYIKKNRPNVKPEILDALKAVYDLNYLLTGDKREHISKQNVDELIDFAVLANAQMALNIYPFFSSTNSLKYEVHQTQSKLVRVAGQTIINGLRKIMKKGRGRKNRTLDLKKFLFGFKSTMRDDDFQTFTSGLFVKKILIGGDAKILTATEVNERFLKNFPQIMVSLLDIVKFKRIEKFSNEKIYELLQKNFLALSEIVMDPSLGNRHDETFFTLEELMDLVGRFFENDKFIAQDWLPVAKIVKKVYMDADESSEVKGKDFRVLINHALKMLKTSTSFYKIWEKFVPALVSPLPVTIDFSEHSHVYPGHLDELLTFERIVKNYRFFRGKFESAYYTKGIKRNPDAVVEIYLFEYLLTKISQTYGTASPKSLGGKGMNRDQLLSIISKIEPVLVKMDLMLPHRKEATTDNIALLATLFQYQSDDNGLLDANEATELAVSLLTSMEMAKTLMSYYETQVPDCKFDEYGRIPAKCFRENFFKSVCESFDDGNSDAYRDGYRAFYPHLFESIGAKSCDELKRTEAADSFLDVSLKAARLCMNYKNSNGSLGEEIPYSKGDLFIILVVFMHAEATTLRWDDVNNKGNGNNIMDPPEVERAYSIYTTALDGLLINKPAVIKAFKKQIYQFLIKTETVPDTSNPASIKSFIGFLASFDKKAPAYRRTLAAVLYQIGMQNNLLNEAAGNPTFDCNWLKEPDNIPKEFPLSRQTPTPAPRDYSYLLNFIKVSPSSGDREPVFSFEKERCLTLFKKEFCL
jgi:hypothetical protein